MRSFPPRPDTVQGHWAVGESPARAPKLGHQPADVTRVSSDEHVDILEKKKKERGEKEKEREKERERERKRDR